MYGTDDAMNLDFLRQIRRPDSEFLEHPIKIGQEFRVSDTGNQHIVLIVDDMWFICQYVVHTVLVDTRWVLMVRYFEFSSNSTCRNADFRPNFVNFCLRINFAYKLSILGMGYWSRFKHL